MFGTSISGFFKRALGTKAPPQSLENSAERLRITVACPTYGQVVGTLDPHVSVMSVLRFIKDHTGASGELSEKLLPTQTFIGLSQRTFTWTPNSNIEVPESSSSGLGGEIDDLHWQAFPGQEAEASARALSESSAGRLPKRQKIEEGFQSSILDREQSVSLIRDLRKRRCSQFFPTSQSPSLLYRSSRDGPSPGVFHGLCDDKGPTLVICKDLSGKVLGGFAEVSWSSKNEHKPSTKSLLFQFFPSEILFYRVQNHDAAIGCQQRFGPCFDHYEIEANGLRRSLYRFEIRGDSGLHLCIFNQKTYHLSDFEVFKC
jgi:hypothetical protein